MNNITNFSKSFVIISSIIVISGILIEDKPAFASTVTWTGFGDGINWSDPNNWSTGVLPASGDDIIIDGNNVTNSDVELDTNFVLTGSLTINSGDVFFSFHKSTFTNNGGTITNLGVFDNIGIFTNSGGTITNLGHIDNIGIFTNSGKLFNQGRITIGEAPIFNTVNGTMTNSGIIGCANGEIANDGKLINTNSGIIRLEGSAGGCLNNFSTGDITNQGRILIGDNSLRNFGNFVNLGTIELTFPGITSEAEIDNKNVLNNWGYISCCDVELGEFGNTGTINNICTGTINGTVTGNPPNTLPCPTATLTGWMRVDVILTNVRSTTGTLNMNVTLLSDNTLVPVVWKTKTVNSPSNGEMVFFANFHTSTPVGQFFVCASEPANGGINKCTLYPLSKHQVTVTFDVPS